MTGPLRLSHNELSALLKYVFQGLFGHTQDWGALAENVLWLETHGYKGITKLVDAIETKSLRKFDGAINHTADKINVDFAGNSLLMGLPILVDLVVAYSARGDAFCIEVTSASQEEALIAVGAAIRENDINVGIDLSTMMISGNAKVNSQQLDFVEADGYYNKCLRDGIPMEVKTYAYLNAIADKTLVEATEASRRGAGE